MNKVFVSDQYLEETNVFIVNFSDNSMQSHDLTQPIPDKIQDIKVLNHHILQIQFSNDEEKHYNISNRLTGVFSFLKDVNEFKKVKIMPNGRSIGWIYQGKLIDLWIDSLYFHSYPTQV